MRRTTALLVSTTLLAGTTLLAAIPAQPATAEQRAVDSNGRGGVGDATVVAVLDYAPLSPYHWDLDARHMPQAQDGDPTNDLPLDRPPHEWLPGFPATDAPGHAFTPIDLTLSDEVGAADESTVTRKQLTDKDAHIWKHTPPDAGPGQLGVVKESTYRPDGAQPKVDVNVHWFKDTKILAALEFGSLDSARSHPVLDPEGQYQRSGLNRTSPRTDALGPGEGGDGHAVGTTSASVGNLHGACPECLLVFLEVDVGGINPLDLQPTDTAGVEEALRWAMDQSWIDAIVMPGTPSATPLTRERLYLGSDPERQRDASVAGKTLFFSSGNGLDGARALVPSTTLVSSMQGPDWVITVSGTNTVQDRDNTQTGFGKPVDVSGPAFGVPTAYGSTTVSGNATTGFVATSLGVAVAGGAYAKALYEVRSALPGASRGKAPGEVASGPPRCDGTRPTACELADGSLTADELRRRYLLGALPTDPGALERVFVHQDGPTEEEDEYLVREHVEEPREADFAGEGHGTYEGRCIHDAIHEGDGPAGVQTSTKNSKCRALTPAEYAASREIQDVVGPILGDRQPPVRRPGEAEWFVVDSWCRQLLWGSWEQGFYKGGPLPAADPAFPLRTAYEKACLALATAYPPR